ncbi:MAG TPA: hypothetical protein VLT32_18960 [Candidatus Sulfomarinibacteraceae bacterium]|nr:hypothetical protein [Candidatus Sulfomarinibacteraceae bacterium]
MAVDDLLQRLQRDRIVSLTRDELEALLERALTLRDDDTLLAGRIRILAFEDRTLVQEQTTGGEVLVRQVGSEAAAQRLVDDRLATYERMWDGCGCKVDYRRLDD